MEKIKAEIINNLIEKYTDEWEYLGIRIQKEPFEIGRIFHLSHVWADGEDLGEELDGICAIKADKYNSNTTRYFGNHIAILGSMTCTYGEDADEIIMEDAEVLEILA